MTFFCSPAIIDICDHQGRTPLMLACAQARPDAAIVFLSMGANVHKTDRTGATSLMLACSSLRENHELIRRLVGAGSFCRDRDNSGYGITSYIRSSSHIKTLHECGCTFNGPMNPRKKGELTYLMELVKNQCGLLFIRELLSTGVDVNEKDQNGATALDYAVKDADGLKGQEIITAIQDAGGVHGQKYSRQNWWGTDKRRAQSKTSRRMVSMCCSTH